MGAKQLDLIGMRYNMLVVVEKLPSRVYGDKSKYHKKRMWLCKCDCGNMTEANTGSLTCDKKKSCGCLTPTKSAENSIKSRHKIAKQDGGYRSVFSRYKQNARSRKLNFNIDQNEGVIVLRVVENSPAQKAGMQAGDIIETVAGNPVKTASDVQQGVETSAIGGKLEIEINRRGKQQTLTVQPGVFPSKTSD
jgi:membrane-associated protease RseP (regulator of RpoE activity)